MSCAVHETCTEDLEYSLTPAIEKPEGRTHLGRQRRRIGG